MFLAPPPRATAATFQQFTNILVLSNGNVRLEFNLNSGRSDFFWQNTRKITGFYAGVSLANYVTSTSFSNRTWSALGSTQVVVTATAAGLPALRQYFVLAQSDSFLTRVELAGFGLSSTWMGPVVMDTTGGVDIGSYTDPRALYVPFDNDHFVRYNALSLNSTMTSYEVSAFYDNATRSGLVVGSVTHDQWKTGIYFSGSNNKLNNLNVFGGATSPKATWDAVPHGPVVGNTISSPIMFVGFGSDWRAVLEAFADANAAQVPKLPWSGGVPFGWNSWYAFGTSLNYNKAIGVSDFLHTNLAPQNFNNQGVVYVNLDSYWDNLSDSQLQSFVDHCHANGQKAGIYWSPFVWWGSPANLSNSVVEGSSYHYSDVALRTPSGIIQTNDGAIAMDPTHPGIQQRTDYYLNNFLNKGFDYIKLDFLSHGAMEGVHYDPNVTTGIEAYNQGMQYLLSRLNGRMFISESIAPLFPYQYGHARRIACDTSHSIGDTEYEMQSVSYGWWLSGRLYTYNDPDLMQFAGATANENQSRLLSGAVSGTVFLNSDDLTSSTGQSLALNCLTNPALNAVARNGRTFRPIEGNTGNSATDGFVGQDGTNYYLALFNYTASAVDKTNDLNRAGIPPGTTGALDLWSGTLLVPSGSSLVVHLEAKQSKLLRLLTNATFAVSASPALQTVPSGGSTNFNVSVLATANLTGPIVLGVSGLPAGASASFTPVSVTGSGSAVLAINVANGTPSGTYPLTLTGTAAGLTNTTTVSLVVGRGQPANLRWTGAGGSAWDYAQADWLNLQSGMADQFYPGDTVLLDDTAGVPLTLSIGSGVAVSPAALTNNSSINNFTISGAGKITGQVNLLKTGAGTLTLSTANDFTGTVTVTQGTLKQGAASALGATNTTVGLTNGGGLDLNGLGLGAQPLLVSGSGPNGAGAIFNSGGPAYDNGNALNNVTLTGDATFGGPTRWDLGGGAGGSLSTGGKPWNVTLTGTAGGIYYEWMNLSVDAALANINVLAGATLGDKGTTTLGNPASTLVVYPNATLAFYNSTANVVFNKQLLVDDGATVQNGGGANTVLSQIDLGTNSAGAGGNCTFKIGGTSLTLNNSLSGPGNLIKTGNSPLKVAAASAYTGSTFINAGKLSLTGSGSLATSPLLLVAAGASLDASGRSDGTLGLAAGQTLSGSGTVVGTLAVGPGSTLGPGTSVGTLTNTGSTLLQSGGTYACAVINGAGAAGVGWDLLSTSGNLGVQANPAGPFRIQLLSLNGSGLPGGLTNFNNHSSYSWTIAAGTLTNFAPAAFNCDSTAFSNDLAGGYFLVRTSSPSSLNVVFTNNHPPTAFAMTVVRPPGAPLKIALADLATNWTDPDGDPIVLLGINASANGIQVQSNSAYLYYTTTNNSSDSFTYTVRDVRNSYRPGDTVLTAVGSVSILVSGPVTTNRVVSLSPLAPGTNRLAFSGWPNYPYVVQFATNLPPTAWWNLSTNQADSNGLWTVLDNGATNNQRFYRSVYSN